MDYRTKLKPRHIALAERLDRWLQEATKTGEISEDRKVKSATIVAVVRSQAGVKITGSQVREYIYYLRTVKKRLIASSSAGRKGGYWLAKDEDDYSEKMKHMVTRAAKELYAMRAPIAKAKWDQTPELFDAARQERGVA